MSSIAPLVVLASESGEEPLVNVWLVGLIAFAILIGLLAAVIAIGGGRDHS
ncbi:hypothetical protein [uncultured Nocardioides sp.]|uniref:hypothetical protein n=1 Tax=uncultured Nocardioides sp. TaxID=198441 RepID=UPI002608DFA1|nr:hypothetical protein [uncultured Nocardioides sp.]